MPTRVGVRVEIEEKRSTLHAAGDFVMSKLRPAAQDPDFEPYVDDNAGNLVGLDWDTLVAFCQKKVEGCHVKHVETVFVLRVSSF